MKMSDLSWERVNRDTELSQVMDDGQGNPIRFARKTVDGPTGPRYQYGLYTSDGPVQWGDALMIRCFLIDAKPYKHPKREPWLYR